MLRLSRTGHEIPLLKRHIEFQRRSLSRGTGNNPNPLPHTENYVDVKEVVVISQKQSALGLSTIKEQLHAPFDPIETPGFLKHPRTCGLVGMPMSWGQPHGGTDQGPDLLRKRGIVDFIKGLEWRISDHRDIEFEEPKIDDPNTEGLKLKNAYAVGMANRKLAEKTYELAKSGQFALTMGGDHSIALGSIAGLLKARPDMAIVWVDAHADINTPETSPSGNLHGMPIAFLMGLSDIVPPGFEWLSEYPKLSADSLAYVGLRDVDEGERRLIKDLNIKAYSMYEVDRYGIGAVMEHCLQAISPQNSRPIHLSYDIDAVDPDLAPATGTMVRGGFTLREAHYICERMAETGMLGSMDIVEVNPTLTCTDGASATVELGVQLVLSAMGNRIL
mmetsp:Transcript_12004/g.29538  ORF Transcript_12004/g.29538 Transcript_12004/m.29538 type:complete len:389 (-) Transcript_12004:237-1403(-)